MQYTRIISEEHFSAGRPLVIVLPIAVKESISEEVGYLIKALHTSGRWPILVYNVSNNINENMYTDINKHEAYIIPISGPCEDWTEYISRFQQQVYEMSADNNTWHSWNPRAKFIVSVMSNCEHKENTEISRAILSELWLNEVMEVAVLFLVSNERDISDLQRNTNDSVYGTYLEIHSWFPYQNSERCHPTESNVPVKVFKARNFSEIKKRYLFQKNYKKNFHKCPIGVHVQTAPPFVNPPKRVWKKDFNFQNVYEGGWEIELLGVVGNALNISLDFQVGKETEYLKGSPAISVGGYATLPSTKFNLMESTRSYLIVRFVWYTPCSLKYQRWNRFFNIFSVHLWISFAFSLVLAVITVRCISNYGHKSHTQESKFYSNIFSATFNIIAVSLSVSVNTQPRSAPLRLFFLCWVCYSVAISTVFQSYLTTFLIEPGYVEPIKTVEQMLNYEKKFGYVPWQFNFFSDTSESLNSAILKKAVHCPDGDTCFKWAAVCQNLSTILDDIAVQKLRANGKWSNENNMPLLCALEDGVVRTYGFVFLVRNGIHFLELINDVIFRVVEGGIFTHMQKRTFYIQKSESKFNSPTFADTYIAISISHLQAVFYLLLLGYVLAVASFVSEIMWHCCRSKRRETNITSLCQERT
jgi:hypothetical protein